MSTALAFTDQEAIITYTSRLMEEDRLYFVAIGGPPLLGILLAKQMHAPAIAYVVEDGTIAPQMPMPTPPFMIGAGLASSRAVAWTDSCPYRPPCPSAFRVHRRRFGLAAGAGRRRHRVTRRQQPP